MVIKNNKVVRTSQGLVKHRSKRIGFMKTNVMTNQSRNIIQKMASKRLGIREKKKLLVQQQIKKRPQKQKQTDDDIVEGVEQNFILNEVKISPEEENILNQFKLLNGGQNDKQSSKVLKQFEENLQQEEDRKHKENILSNPKVVLVYENVGDVLKQYRSGQLPKPLHVVPQLEHWKQVLQLTRPQEWTPQAVFAITKIFCSSMGNTEAEQFYQEFILPAVRHSIKEDRKLNVHLYNALIKALYKPQAWTKGILLPLCMEPDFTLKEAQIIGSILLKQSVPMIHSSIIIFKLTQMAFTGPIAVILKVMIDKRYSLPERVLNELVTYFVGFSEDPREMPVIWHQTLLKVTEIYTFSSEQRQALKSLINKKVHHLITPEIVKCLGSNKSKMEMEK